MTPFSDSLLRRLQLVDFSIKRRGPNGKCSHVEKNWKLRHFVNAGQISCFDLCFHLYMHSEFTLHIGGLRREDDVSGKGYFG